VLQHAEQQPPTIAAATLTHKPPTVADQELATSHGVHRRNYQCTAASNPLHAITLRPEVLYTERSRAHPELMSQQLRIFTRAII